MGNEDPCCTSDQVGRLKVEGALARQPSPTCTSSCAFEAKAPIFFLFPAISTEATALHLASQQGRVEVVTFDACCSLLGAAFFAAEYAYAELLNIVQILPYCSDSAIMIVVFRWGPTWSFDPCHVAWRSQVVQLLLERGASLGAGEWGVT